MTPRPRKLLSAFAVAATGATLAGCPPPREGQATTLPAPAAATAAPMPAPAAATHTNAIVAPASATAPVDVGAPLCGPDGRPLPGNNRKVSCTMPAGDPRTAAKP